MNGIDKYSILEPETWEPEDAGTVYFLIKEKERKEEEEKKQAKEEELSVKFFPI